MFAICNGHRIDDRGRCDGHAARMGMWLSLRAAQAAGVLAVSVKVLVYTETAPDQTMGHQLRPPSHARNA